MRVRTAPWWLALVLAVCGGLLLDAATPAVGWWPAVLLGAASVCVALWQHKFWFGVVLGVVAGAAFWGPHISWLTLYLGPVPWLALATAMVLWFGIMGGCVAFVTRHIAILERVWPLWLVMLAQVLSVAGLWVARELVQSNWPYGGFAWGRLAIAVADAPGVGVLSWLGFAGVSGVLAACAAAVAALLWSGPVGRAAATKPAGEFVRWGGAHRLWAGAGVVVFAAVACLVVPAASLPHVGTLRVAAVQGNSASGIFDDRESGSVLGDHIEATRVLLDELEESGQTVDVIVWPENSAEYNLPEKRYASQTVARLAARANAPIVVGSILPTDTEGEYTNSTLVYTASGVTELQYDKRRPVPFAEYMPNREFFHALAPDLVDLVQLEYRAGERSTVLPIEVGAGGADSFTLEAGIAICFDIIFDDHAVELDRDGAQLVFAQTNNADFGRTDQSAQQLQIAHARAVELGRAVVNISTVGTSAVILPDGDVAGQLEPFTADAVVATVPLVEGSTPALRFGGAIAGFWVLLAATGGAAAVGLAVWGRRRDGSVVPRTDNGTN